MGNPFARMKKEGLEQKTDNLGGGFQVDTNIYVATIKMAYAGKSPGGAESMSFEFDLNGKEFNNTQYVSSKSGDNFYVVTDKDKKPVMIDGPDGTKVPKKRALPGFEIADDICMIAAGKELNDPELEYEEKKVLIWDKDQGKKIPKSVQVAVELIGKQVALAITKTLENKSVKSGNDYVATADTVNRNEIAKVFDVDSKLTVLEATDEKPAAFWEAWLEKNLGKVQDKRTIKDGEGGQSGRPARAPQDCPPLSGGDTPTRSSLFNKK